MRRRWAPVGRHVAIAVVANLFVVLLVALWLVQSRGDHTASQLWGALSLVLLFAAGSTAVAVQGRRALRRRLESERLQAEQAERLRESEERLRITFQTSPDAIGLTRAADGVYVAVNEGYTKITGYAEAELVGHSTLELGLWTDPADRARMIEEIDAHGSVSNLEARFRTKSGALITGLLSARRITIGGVPMLVTVTRDVSDWKRAEEERDRLEAQMRQAQKLESIGQLAGGVAHDFNNLLTVVLGCAEAMRTDLAEGRPIDPEDLEQIGVAGERARDLTRQLLAFARKQVIAPVALDLNEVVHRAEKLLRRTLREDIALEVRGERDLWPVWCDPVQIEQVLLNLAVNACDAMPEGGTLTVEARNVPAPADASAAAEPADWVQLVVRDTGVGMTPEVQAHLFEPFFTTKPPGQGTGLGLATVHGIVTQSGGHLRVESAPDRGTRFEIRFPRTRRAPPPRPASPASPAVVRARGAERILVIEDDEQVRSLTVGALGGAGYRVLVAGDAAEARRIVRDTGLRQLDLVVTDVVMPGESGRDVAAALQRERPDLPVLFVSGYPRDALKDRGGDGAVHFLAKPFTPATLLETVSRVLDAKRP